MRGSGRYARAAIASPKLAGCSPSQVKRVTALQRAANGLEQLLGETAFADVLGVD
jgi:hypothetical protein